MLLNPAFEHCSSLLALVPVDPFPNNMNRRQHRENENDQNRHSVAPPGLTLLRLAYSAIGERHRGVLHGEYGEASPSTFSTVGALTPESTMLALLGHMSRAMLEHYSHVRLAPKRVAVEALTTRVSLPVLEPTATNSTTVAEAGLVQ